MNNIPKIAQSLSLSAGLFSYGIGVWIPTSILHSTVREFQEKTKREQSRERESARYIKIFAMWAIHSS